ncbi:hypothetical protein TPHA_0O00580 [Tetrapisispora phaffii CBS 4417]|uniref:Uncharacterized protein n=1 Tax=Tetrapisispora phaffii (strain ATCC 24235 / CBS 4417 / NBRC 1672 / NRRL Y-8282 / UCD 70-5) TaxID=1071381 RepID=G8C1K0_TETPH|nr:hypothetical protein TPHA_0O00580 [Tetrapisispora phaffii CBS 4417]CCE66028.1 hypothetical protein TPHA_0O00580 [Tetrapisispora phaffii CBS 4417]
MGGQASKSSETQVFIPRSQVDFSESLLATLESSKETDYTRSQIAERYIEQRVSDRLSQLEEDTLKKFETKLELSLNSNTEDSTKEPILSTKLLQNKIEELNKRLSLFENKDSEKKITLQSLDDDKGVRRELLKCLLDNSGKPLNCYDLIQQFKQKVSESTP